MIFIQRYHTDEYEKKATNYCTRLGHSLRSVISCQRKGVNWLVRYETDIFPISNESSVNQLLFRRRQDEHDLEDLDATTGNWLFLGYASQVSWSRFHG